MWSAVYDYVLCTDACYIMQVPLGFIPHNEQATDEMVSILEHLHQYVPVVQQEGDEANTYSPIPFGGDQLTAARATTAKKVRVTSQG